jgi:type IV secretory pathway VirB10-like protein
MDNATGVPQIEDKRPKILRALPKNAQSRLLAGIAVVMVAIILFSGRQPVRDHPTPQPYVAATSDPNLARIAQYRRDIDEQARKLAEEEARLAQTKETLQGQGPGGDRSRCETMLRASEPPARIVEPAQNGVESEREKREYQSLFASNLVVSFRAPVAANPSEHGFEPEKPAPTVDVTAPARVPPDPARKEYRIPEGTILETVLTNRLDSSFSGPINCMVTTNVYSEDRQTLLIPQGSRVLGEVRKLETMGEQRLAVFFHRVMLPNGSSVNLDRFQGLSQIGETGLQDLVNHHYVQIFGVSIALGALAGLAQANTRYSLDESAAQAYEQGVSNSLSQSATHILDRYLNVLPTFTIREGQRVKVYLSQDLLAPAYSQLND